MRRFFPAILLVAVTVSSYAFDFGLNLNFAGGQRRCTDLTFTAAIPVLRNEALTTLKYFAKETNMATALSDRYLYELVTKQVDLASDVFKIALMDSAFTFNRATHDTYALVSASELPTAYGYTAGGATLTGLTLSRDNVLHMAKATWNNASWSVSGGNLVSNGAIIYDNTHASKIVVGYIDFGGTQTTYAGGVATISTPTVINMG